MSQDRAVHNARSATTHLFGRRVEREEVELFFEDLAERQAEAAATPAMAEHAREVLPR